MAIGAAHRFMKKHLQKAFRKWRLLAKYVREGRWKMKRAWHAMRIRKISSNFNAWRTYRCHVRNTQKAYKKALKSWKNCLRRRMGGCFWCWRRGVKEWTHERLRLERSVNTLTRRRLRRAFEAGPKTICGPVYGPVYGSVSHWRSCKAWWSETVLLIRRGKVTERAVSTRRKRLISEAFGVWLDATQVRSRHT